MEQQTTRRGAKPERLSSVANAIRLIKSFADDDYEIGISALSIRLGLAKSTVHRLATTLLEAGLLEQNPVSGRYRLGLLMFELGSLVRRKINIYAEAKPWLMKLRDQTGETIRLAVLGHGSAVYINILESPKAVRMALGIGQPLPVHSTAEGKVLLAFRPPEFIERSIEAGLEQRTAQTIVDPAALREQLAVVRARGYATDDEECEPGVRGIAAPLRDDSGNVAAALGIAGPIQRLSKRSLMALAPTLIEASKAISRRLGDRSRASEPLRSA